MGELSLYMVQSDDGPVWVVAESWESALARWRAAIIVGSDPGDWEDGEPHLEPDGIQLICRNEELLLPEEKGASQHSKRGKE